MYREAGCSSPLPRPIPQNKGDGGSQTRPCITVSWELHPILMPSLNLTPTKSEFLREGFGHHIFLSSPGDFYIQPRLRTTALSDQTQILKNKQVGFSTKLLQNLETQLINGAFIFYTCKFLPSSPNKNTHSHTHIHTRAYIHTHFQIIKIKENYSK